MRLSDIEITPTVTLKESKSIIREHRSVGQILLELNVINIPAIDNFMDAMVAAREELPDGLKRWFTNRGKKYIINSEDNNELITNFSRNAEPWMKKRQKEGVALHKFTPTNDLRTNFEHILDWLVSLYNNAGGAGEADQARMAASIRTIKGLKNMSMAQALEASSNWMGRIDASVKGKGNVSVADEGEGIQKVLDVGDGYAWYTLTSDECITREGHRIQNCLKQKSFGWPEKVKSGNTQLFSLRDVGNNPYMAIEVTGGQLVQIKGKQNRAPLPIYIPYAIPMLNKLAVPPNHQGSGDINAMNVSYHAASKTYGTLFDLSTIVDSSEKYTTYSIDLHSGFTSYFFTDKKKRIIAKIDERKSYRGRQEGAWVQLEWSGTSESEKRSIAEYIASVSPKLEPGSKIWELGGYLTNDNNGMIVSYDDAGKLLYSEGNEKYRLINDGIFYIVDGMMADKISLRPIMGSERHVVSVGGRDHDIKPSFIKMVNKLNEEDRPYISLQLYGGDYLFQGTDLRVSADVSVVGKKLARSGIVGAYHALSSKSSISDDADANEKSIYIASPGSHIEISSEISVGNDHRIDKNDISNIINVLNKLDINDAMDDHSKSRLENNGIFYSEVKEKFTDNPTTAGVSSSNYGNISAVKTANAIRVFDENHQEMVRFGFSNDRHQWRAGEDKPITISEISNMNRLKVTQNRNHIASILNEFNVGRSGGYDAHKFNDTIKSLGITYSDMNESWKGPMTQPKKIVSKTVKNKKLEIYELKSTGANEYMFYNATDNVHIASLISKTKDTSYDCEMYSHSYDELFARGVELLDNSNNRIKFFINRITSDGTDIRHNSDFYSKLWKHGLVHDVNMGGVKKMEEQYPSSTIARTKTGKWVSEVYNDNDPAINSVMSNKIKDDMGNTYRYSNTIAHQYGITPLVPHGGINNNGTISHDTRNDDYYTFYRRNKPLLRVIVEKEGMIISAIFNIAEDNTQLANNSTLVNFKSEIGKLMKIQKLAGSRFLIDNDLYYNRGKLHEIKDNQKMFGYQHGKITYEDHHQWKKVNADEWRLMLETEDGTKTLITVVVTPDGGLEKIEFTNKQIRKKPRLYQPHLNDLIDIVDDLYSGESE